MKKIAKYMNTHRLLAFSLLFYMMLLMQNTLVFAGEAGSGAPAGFPVKKLIIALVIGLIVALIVNGIFRGQLKSVITQSEARNYVRKDSFRLFVKRDMYLYSEYKREEIKKEEAKQ